MTTRLSERGKVFETADYYVAPFAVPDEYFPSINRAKYGVFNKSTAIRESAWDTMPYAVASALGLQQALERVFKIVDGDGTLDKLMSEFQGTTYN